MGAVVLRMVRPKPKGKGSMRIRLTKYRTATIRMVKRWGLGFGKFSTVYIVQIGPMWFSVDRKRKRNREPK